MQRDILYITNEKNVLTSILSSNGWKTAIASSNEEAQELISANDFLVGIIQPDTTDQQNMEKLENLIFSTPGTEWIALLSQGYFHSSACCRIIAINFFDYHTLPIDHNRLLHTLGHAYGKACLKRKVLPNQKCDFGNFMLGQSPAMTALRKQLIKIGNVDTPILICGESGTGKELVSQLIHKYSARAKAPFVAVNCGALPAPLIQSELFGHEKGAFTGAYQRKVGKIEAARGGTVFLDEIGDLPIELQTNLLRFLQEKTIDRVGSTQSMAIDVRVIAATNVDLEQAVKQGVFREDLYYRLNVLSINIPPLRERKGDIELLANAFLDKFSRKTNPKVRGYTQQALRVMNNHDWPGNVRELINRVHRAVVMTETPLICPEDLGIERRQNSRRTLTLDMARELAEKSTVKNTLLKNRHNISESARQLGVSRVTLYRLIEKFHIKH